MKDLILVRYGEIGTKGGNRHLFEDKLISNIEQSLTEIAKADVYKTDGRIFVETEMNDVDVVTDRLQKVFGIVGVCPAKETALDFEEIKEAGLELVEKELSDKAKTFKVETRRINKGFEYDSMEINRELGAHVLRNTEDLTVDVHNPDFKLNVEIRYRQAYVYANDLPGVGGLPVGSSDKAGLLLSGGIDSPVAGWMAMKRGVELIPIYFHSPPFTSERAKEKVIDLCRVLASYAGGSINLRVVPFTEIQTAIKDECPKKLLTIIMRRLMMKIAEEITENEDGKALITGESIGQVASQTLDSMYVTNAMTKMPVFRPLIGLDKNEIKRRAKDIGTYEISIQPYDDCCTLFVPDNPETKPKLRFVEYAEEDLAVEELVSEAITQTEIIKIEND
ncbi:MULTISPECIES: tRNA uracil 4-sulfurtransferase ThiI [unclassified Candidatus Frackibacter]|uniref:tRNA uracil 4-sulfurtransferase ThiI n=1 Tax=unclassified Candidatus Frackibacter TaxID=2648818 RepID=UPI000797B942|nr:MULTISPECIES: tRNA uracil 4-sulfurtransferase ThiI [unclassified Candidatus Frackibacter]KXS40023.1 MAG: thiamine biosynthesis protein ThiI [Candidatus Frackibacter sp. T328-2]SEM72222.1 thiamine biosynthesis protein ThiI [Candidatus Frackibacter sp. WG12]SFL81993.1 thiamine biosynthesis protein ThiI [Candidatus Frackibacter sp. WG13]